MWNVFNGMSFEQIATEAARYVNLHEITLAARFVHALDASGPAELVEPVYFNQGRVLVRVQGAGSLAKVAKRLNEELDGQRLLGLPVRVVDEIPPSDGNVSSLMLDIDFTGANARQTNARVTVRHAGLVGGWRLLGSPQFKITTPPDKLDVATISTAVTRAIGSTFVTVRPIGKNPGMNTFRIENRLPFTLSGLELRTSRSEDAGTVLLPRLGLGPVRTVQTSAPAAMGFVEKIELNGL
jgi:hypothetical protein